LFPTSRKTRTAIAAEWQYIGITERYCSHVAAEDTVQPLVKD
jgi:hypothetical protein